MPTDNNDLGRSAEFIKAGLLRAAAPRPSSPVVRGAASGSAYHGKSRGISEDMIEAGLKAAGLPPLQSGLLDNDAHARRIGDPLVRDSEARIAEQRPHEKPSEPAKSGEEMIRHGLPRRASSCHGGGAGPRRRSPEGQEVTMSAHMVEQLRLSGAGNFRPERRDHHRVDVELARRAGRIPTALTAEQSRRPPSRRLQLSRR